MRYQDQLIALTEKAGNDLFRSARAVPPDKITWQPLEQGRSILNLVQECAYFPLFISQILSGERDFANETVEEERAKRYAAELATGKTIEECQAAYDKNVPALLSAISNLTEEQLQTDLPLPFRPNKTHLLTELIWLPYWNMVYHLGQIDYIQRLYGDHTMH